MKDVEQFLSFAESEELQVSKIREMDIRRYNFSLKEEGYSAHTVSRKNSALRLFFKFLRQTGVMQHNPIENIKQPEVSPRTCSVSSEELNKLVEFMEEQGDRDRLLFSFLYREKIQLSKIVKLRCSDYRKDQKILYLSERESVPVTEETGALLNQYLDHHPAKENEGAALFQSRNKRPLTESGAYYILKNYFKQCEMDTLRPIDLLK